MGRLIDKGAASDPLEEEDSMPLIYTNLIDTSNSDEPGPSYVVTSLGNLS